MQKHIACKTIIDSLNILQIELLKVNVTREEKRYPGVPDVYPRLNVDLEFRQKEKYDNFFKLSARKLKSM